MSEEKLKKYVNEYFEKYMYVSFDKFIENWEEEIESKKYLQQENKQLKELATETIQERMKANVILMELENLLEEKIKQAKEHDREEYHREVDLIISTYKYVLDKLKELKGSDK